MNFWQFLAVAVVKVKNTLRRSVSVSHREKPSITLKAGVIAGIDFLISR
jgi:hypothetical protein